MTTRVLFVCLGNICRSPTAHGVFRALVEAEGLTDAYEIDSAGTGAWHIGNPPDRRATKEAATRGVDLSDLRARQVEQSDFTHYDYILAMDRSNLSNLKRMAPSNATAQVELFLSYAPQVSAAEVPDPYYGGDDGFAQVFEMIEAASRGLLTATRADS